MARVRLTLPEARASAMPPVCLVCGGPVAALIPKTFVWRPKWASLGFFLALFACFPIAAILFFVGYLNTRRMTIECPMCDRHRNYWAWRGLWVYGPLFALVIATLVQCALALTEALPYEVSSVMFRVMLFGTAFALLAWAVVASLIQNSVIRATEITEDDITLEAVHESFADQVRLARARAKRTNADPVWDEYEPYPRGVK